MVLMRSDTNTKGCIHWFMFTVIVKQPCKITFSLLNNTRNGQLYKDGMKVATLDSLASHKGWHGSGENIYYYRCNVDHAYY